MRRIKYSLAFLVAGSLWAGCLVETGGPARARDVPATQPPPPRAAERPECALAVAPHVLLKPGAPVRLTWSTKNATSAKISGLGPVSIQPGEKALDHPDRTKVYDMEVSGPKGTATCRVAVAVPQRLTPLHWPPAALSAMPADYLVRAQASIAKGILNAQLTSDYKWVSYAVSSLLFEQDVDAVNAYLAGPWQLTQNVDWGFALFSMDFVRLYGLFNSASGTFPGRLTPAAQRHMEEEFHEVVSQTRFNDYRHASNLGNVWTLRGSDNHTLSAQSSFLLVSQFLKNSKDFADRAYEDGRKPAEHYEAWRKYWGRMLDERAKRGIYIEIGSPTYEDESRQALQNIRDFAEDPVLRKKAEMLLDVTYAVIAQDTLRSGARGGAKSRVYTFRSQFFNGGVDPNYELIFGLQNYVPHWTDQATSTYFPPSLVLKLGRETEARGSYENIQRLPGVGDRTGKITTVDPAKSVLRYGFMTPSYAIGSFALDPAIVYAPQSAQNRWQGVAFEGDRAARLGPYIARIARNGRLEAEQRVLDGFASLQDRNVLITQRATDKGGPNIRVEIPVSRTFDGVAEEDGWIFFKEGASFGAIRIMAHGPDAYQWRAPADKNPDTEKNVVALRDPDSPIIIVANQASDYGDDFERFKTALKKQKIEYDRQVLRFADLTFYGPQKIGRRAGATVDLSPPRLYDSPFIRSDWGSGRIFMRFGNDAAVYDFSDSANPRKHVPPATDAGLPPGVGRAEAIVFPH